MPLTQAQLAQHLGALVWGGLTRTLERAQQDAVLTALLDWAEHYGPHGSFGTQAERLEAMTTLMKRLFEVDTGVHPDDNAPALHRYQEHWLPRLRSLR
jgi:hypothetical protein